MNNNIIYSFKGLINCLKQVNKDIDNVNKTIKGIKNKMNSIEYKIIIGGVEKKVGDEVWDDVGKEYVRLLSIGFCFYSRYILKVKDKNGYEFTRNIENLKLEEPIKYQLPDTEGNLSEVKVGQPVWCKIDNDVLEEYEIISCKDICIGLINKRTERHDSVITGIGELLVSGGLVTTNKPKRDFSKYFNFNEAPNGFNFGAVNDNGYAYWFKNKPEAHCEAWVNNGSWDGAGFRQNLINPETGIVDDWKDSLVERPKGV